LKENGITTLQGSHFQLEPQIGTEHSFRKIFRYSGQVNKSGQYNLVRTCYFEPSEDYNFDFEGDCLKRIRTAFFWGKPAIISTHRLNYIGFIDPVNRARNLPKLKSFLARIVKEWPDAEFITSDQLINL